MSTLKLDNFVKELTGLSFVVGTLKVPWMSQPHLSRWDCCCVLYIQYMSACLAVVNFAKQPLTDR